MSTTHRVKMAKASQKDIDGAIELYQFLQAMNSGRSCPEVVDEFGYKGYEDLLEREATDVEFALRAHERGGLFRVVWGMQVLLDPCNEVVDPNLPHLELHPKHEQAAKERDAARAEAEQARRDGQEIASGLHEKLAEVRAELAAVKRQRDELVAASEPVADALRDIAGDGHRAYLDAYESAVAKALAAEQPKPQHPEVQP